MFMKKIVLKSIGVLSLIAFLFALFPVSASTTQRTTVKSPTSSSGSTGGNRAPTSGEDGNENTNTNTSTPIITQPKTTLVVDTEAVNDYLAQYNLSISQIQQNLNQLKNVLQLFQLYAEDGIIDQQELLSLMAALMAFNQSSQLDDFVKKLLAAVKTAIEENNLENSADSRSTAKTLLLAAAKTNETYAQTLITLVPNSDISGSDQEPILVQLNSILATYQGSWNRVSAIDIADPASADALKNEFTTYYFNTSKNAYWQTTARPVFGATQTLMVLPKLNRVLPAFQKLDENITKLVDALATASGYADPATAYVLGANYLVGTPSQPGKAAEHLAKAASESQAVIHEGSSAYPFLHTFFASKDMYEGAVMLQSAVNFRVNDEIGLGGEMGIGMGRNENRGIGRDDDRGIRREENSGVNKETKTKKTEKRIRKRK
jgi:hypothetical protein